MSLNNFYSVVNAIKDKSAEAMTSLSSDFQEFKSIVHEDVVELSNSVRQTIQDDRISVERKESDEETKDPSQKVIDETLPITAEAEDLHFESLKSLTSSLLSFDMGSTLGSLSSVQGSLTSVGSKLTSLNVLNNLDSLETMGTKLLNSADELFGTLASDAVCEKEDEKEELSESVLSGRRFRMLALQEDLQTYIKSPVDVEVFEKWKLSTSLEELTEIKKEVLENYPTVGAKFTELVPSVIDSKMFWMHYIHKASLLAAQEQRGADLLEHALKDDEEEISWDANSPKAKDKEGKPIFPDDESKEEEKLPASVVTNAPTSSSGGESWIELDERKESASPNASLGVKEPCSVHAELTPDEADEEDSLDWGDDNDLLMSEASTAAISDAKIPETIPVSLEDSSKRGEDWGEWD